MEEERSANKRLPVVARLSRILGTAHTKSVDWLAIAGGACVVFIMLYIVIDITRRALFGASIKGSVEVLVYALLYVFFFGFAKTQVEKLHVSVTFFKDKFPQQARLILEAVILAIAAGWIFFFTWRAFDQTAYSFSIAEYKPGELRLPFGPQYIGVAIGCLVWGIQVVRELVRGIRKIRRGEG